MDVIKAWKDPVYRASLSTKERESLPAHPAGGVELSDSELDGVSGAATSSVPCGIASFVTAAACNTFSDTLCSGTCGPWSIGCC